MNHRIDWLLAIAFGLLATFARGAGTATPAIALRASTEDGSKMLVATVTVAGRPAANLKVNFFAHRTFGPLGLGTDTTLDDGTAAVNFPSSLPGDAQGNLQLGAEVAGQSDTRVLAVIPGGVPFVPARDEVPRALWSSRAPWLVLGTVGLLIAIVWGAFLYAVCQLCGIRAAAAGAAEAELPQNTNLKPEPDTVP